MKQRTWLRLLAVLLAGILVAAACGDDDDDETTAGGDGDEETGELTDVRLTLQWVTQAQFAGYYAALDQGFYEEEGLNVTIQPGGPDINPIQLLISGDTDIGIQPLATVMVSREGGADVVSMGQVFERAAFRLVYFDDAGIETVDDWVGKTIGLWGGFEPAVFAAMNKFGHDIETDAEIFNQGFDMVAFLDGQLNLASAMTYNEYAQALAGNDTGQEILLWDPNEEGTAVLEDSLVTTETWLADNPEAAEAFVRGTARGWIYCRDNAESCIDIVLENGTALPRDFQTWQMNEVNKLIWPSTNGLLNITTDMFQGSADILFNFGVIDNEATPDAYDISIRDKALADFSDDDLFGNDFQPLDLDPFELFGGES